MHHHIRGWSVYSIVTTLLCLYLIVQLHSIEDPRKLTDTYEAHQIERTTNEESRQVQTWSCTKLFEGDPEEQNLAMNYIKTHPLKIQTDAQMLRLAQDCPRLKKQGYREAPVSTEEAAFPIAFSILLHEDVFQAERLLRLIYHPQNLYCIHVDGKANGEVLEAMRSIADCFPNVHIASKLETVVYAGFSRLQADINCMSDMLTLGKNWKYYINLASSVLPLRTNREMVQILKLFNGANDIEGITGKRMMKSRFSYVHETRGNSVIGTSVLKSPTPHGIEILKGSAYGTFSRGFVDFIVNDQKAKDLLEWCKDIYSPDEYYWATLNHLEKNPHLKTPGGYSGKPDEKAWLSTYASWGWPCYSGITRHGVCIFGIGDLPHLINRKELFANKFDTGVQYIAAECLHEHLHNRTVAGPPMSDLYYYSQLPFIAKSR